MHSAQTIPFENAAIISLKPLFETALFSILKALKTLAAELWQ